jgi:hypothetical protein
MALGAGVGGCDSLADVAVTAGDFGGATADAHCDRRIVTTGGQAEAFCQEVVATVAAAQFADDCRDKHQAAAAPGLCPRGRVIAGCKLRKQTDDDSLVWDWYYDVSELVAEAGPRSGPEGGPTFETTPRTVDDVRQLCASPSRYEEGAELVLP